METKDSKPPTPAPVFNATANIVLPTPEFMRVFSAPATDDKREEKT